MSQDLVQETRAYNCIDCGVCTGSCPVARVNGQFSPRMTVERFLVGLGDEVEMDKEIWSCLSCGLCTVRCPSQVDYLEFIQEARADSVAKGTAHYVRTHTGIIEAMERLQGHRAVETARKGWLTDGLQVAEQGEWMLFVGCLPVFEAFFRGPDGRGIGADLTESLRAAVRMLNAAGIVPAVRAEERCCGHDRLWLGDRETFAALAEANREVVAATGAKYVVCVCPECARTLKLDYSKEGVELGVEVLHVTELFARLVEEGKLKVPEQAEAPAHTYHDPCRLGRHMGVFDAPRKALETVGVKLAEMPRHGEQATCCGTSCWTNCDMISEQIRRERIEEAVGTGAEVLVTACPKCQVHFRCTLSDNPDWTIQVRDITCILAERMGLGGN